MGGFRNDIFPSVNESWLVYQVAGIFSEGSQSNIFCNIEASRYLEIRELLSLKERNYYFSQVKNMNFMFGSL